MKSGWWTLLLLCSTLIAEEPWQPLPAPMLSMDERYPVDLDEQARRELLERDESAKNVERFKEREVPWFSILLVGAAIVYVAFGGKKEKVREISLDEIEKTLQQKTVIELETLREGLEGQSADQFYVALTRILRTYIETSYGLPAETSTTEEFFSKLQITEQLNKSESQGLSDFMLSADRVKFAREEASREDREEAVNYALNFVRAKKS